MNPCLQSLVMWPAKRWLVAMLASLGTFVFMAYATALIENPIFGRAIAPTAWAIPVTIVTSILSGLLLATYVSNPIAEESKFEMRSFTVGSIFAFFAVGCPVCNKLVLIALGTTGAIQWFAPVQPILAVLAIGLLAWALKTRLMNEFSCQIPTRKVHANDGNN